MMKKTRWLLLLSFLFVTLLLPTSAAAQTKSFYWERFDVEMTLRENGNIDVVETQVLNFSGAPFTFGFGTILTGSEGNNDGITNITLREGDLNYVQATNASPGTFKVSESSNEVRIDWYFAPATGQRTYTFSYTIKGGVIVGTDEAGSGDQIFWKAIPYDHPGRINNSIVTIYLPEGVTPQREIDSGDYLVEGFADGNSNLVETQVSDNGRILTYTLTQPLLSGNPLEVRVQFPHAVLDIPTPEWQLRQQNSDVYTLIGVALSVLLLVTGPLAVIALWYVRGRDPETGLVVPEYVTAPPSTLPPAVVGTLVDEKADMRDIISTLVDLAQRGYISISENKMRNHTFKLEHESKEGLRPFEAQFLKNIFRSSKERTLADLRYKFAKYLPKLRTMLYEELISEGLVDRSPEKVRTRYGVGAALIIMVAIILFIALAAILPEGSAFVALCGSISLAVTAITLGVVGQHMPSKTAKGAEEKAKWDAFHKYLQNIEAQQDMEQAAELFEKYLPYATAFGMDRRWIHKFSSVQSTPIPRWYIPYGLGRTMRQGGNGRPAPSGGGAAPQMPSLDSAAKGMTGGLESMSAGLTRMLNSTASTLRSTPPTSSSSGSSGGFSGGFSSGSSGGGGSRGFG
ncbi:hypothetical protein MNBD_CHLOROFLEXI01-4600 [hydrothermal vent metagenome]|uniref:DUF2207 domain-containing protein n=1 Tax=hydrothermal vent metagenome TaxID=652676 RepID=A0A3B0USC9_9ZZZZ